MIKSLLVVWLSLQNIAYAMDTYKDWVQKAKSIEVVLEPEYSGQKSIQIEIDDSTSVSDVKRVIAYHVEIGEKIQKSLVPLIKTWGFWYVEGNNYIYDLDVKIKLIMNRDGTGKFKLTWSKEELFADKPKVTIIDDKSLSQCVVVTLYRGKNIQ